MPSVAARMEAHALRELDAVPIQPKDLADWAAANGVDLRVEGNKLPVVNARRTELGLPPFRVIKPRTEQTIAAPQIPLIAASEAELLHLVRTFDGTRIGLMTPECAGWLLKLNTSNRRLDRSSVARFTKIIAGGIWRNTSEPVIVAREAMLNDGQHRLTAIVETGTAVPVDVRFGIAREAFLHSGTAAGRTPAQALAIMGEQHAVPQAAVARLLLLYDSGRLGATGSSQVETIEIVRTIRDNAVIPPVAAFMVGSKFAPTRTAAFGFVLAAGARVSRLEDALSFGALVASGRGDDRDPTRLLHLRLRDARMGARARLASIETAVLAARAWNAWINGRPVSILKVTSADLAVGGFPAILGRSAL